MGSSSATRNAHLSNYGFGIYQDLKSPLAQFIAPRVGTGLANGQYKAYNTKNAFQVYETLRAMGGPNNRIQFAADDPFFNCVPRGLEIGIDDAERTKAGADNQRSLEEARVKTLVSTTILSHEKTVFDKANAIPAVAGAGVWSDPEVDPISEINAELTAMVTRTGIIPNRMVLGLGSWNVIREHPLVKARLVGGEVSELSMEKFKTLLLFPGIDVRIGLLSRDTTKFGKAQAAVNIAGASLLIFFGQDSPNEYDPSFMKTFMPTAGAIDSVMQYRDDRNNSDFYKTNWEDDIKVISTLLGSRIALS